MPFDKFTITQLTDNGKSRLAAISPDGKYLLLVVSGKGKQSLWLRNIRSNSDMQVIAPEDTRYENPLFSPDGNFIYFRKSQDKMFTLFHLYQAPVLGGAPQIIVRDVDDGITFSPDGKRFVFCRNNNPELGNHYLLMANADGTAEQLIASGTTHAMWNPSWSPDGTRIATTTFRATQNTTAIYMFDISSGRSSQIPTPRDMWIDGTVWVPSGSGFIVNYRNRETGYQRDQIGFLGTSGDFHTITQDTNTYYSLTISPDGKTLATVQEKSQFSLYLLPTAGAEASSVNPALLVQGKDLRDFGWAGKDELLINEGKKLLRVSSEGNNRRTILEDTGALIGSANSCAGGRYVVLEWLGHNEGRNLWLAASDGSNLKQLTRDVWASLPVCSPDGKWVYFQDEKRAINRVSIDGGSQEVVAASIVPGTWTDEGFSISPDGKLLTFKLTHRDTHKIQIAVVGLDKDAGKSVSHFLDADPRISGYPEFTPDGKAVVYSIAVEGVENLWLQPINGETGRQITNFQTDWIESYQYSPDGRTLGVLREHFDSDVVLLRDTTLRK